MVPVRPMYYVAHGGPHEGLGHLYRCTALAQATQDPAPVLLTPSVQAARGLWPTHGEIRSCGHTLDELLQQLPQGSTVVIDTYRIDASLTRALESHGHTVIRLDDNLAPHVQGSVVLNHAAAADQYCGRTEPYSRVFAGLPYAVVRPAFRAALRTRTLHSVEHIALCLGGADPANLTLACAQALLQHPLPRLTILAGSAYAHLDSLHTLATHYPAVHVLHNLQADDLVQVLDACDVVVCSASTIAIEACCRARPCIALEYADNQRSLADYLARHGLAHVLKPEQLPALAAAVHDVPRLQSMAMRQAAMRTDHSSLTDVVDYARTLSRLQVSLAGPDDSDRVLSWANDPAVRRYSVQTHAIAAHDHARWYAQTLARTQRTLLLISLNDQTLGYVRLDHPDTRHPQAYAVSIALDASARGRGLATPILAAGIRHFCLQHVPAVAPPVRLTALIHPDNHASQRLFTNLGFMPSGTDLQNGTSFVSYEK